MIKHKLIFILVAVLSLSLVFSTAYAVYVHGYFKKNGTYVQPYYRTSPDSSPYNNYSYPGNYNPNTGTTTPGNSSTYLNNYYKSKSYYPSIYSSPSISIPNCPIFSTYNSVSKSCECNHGYWAENGKCTSALSYCWKKFGYGATYNSVSDKCECSSGYRTSTDALGNQKCVSENSYCTDKYGYGARYNSLKDQCECRSGYIPSTDIFGNQTCKLDFNY